ncbi:protein phosphatase [Lithospermum erythrorhizon]|uniref:protein-serine/threonine phosphatase n=1 Tax=Lithospermum erythrorhizon TaxID=34254 RepID=A0AAV3NN82_LITER
MILMPRNCCGKNMCETETTTPIEPSSGSSRKRRMEIHQFRFVASDSMLVSPLENGRKRHRVDALTPQESEDAFITKDHVMSKIEPAMQETIMGANKAEENIVYEKVKYGSTSVCGKRRDMEDAVAIYPSFTNSKDLNFYGVYDGHGCSHVASSCRDRMHEILKDEVEKGKASWEEMMVKSFSKMDEEVVNCCNEVEICRSNCRCELQTPQCDAVGSTAVVAVVSPDKIVVSNCGDSRAVLCRKGVAIPLSSDHKPDRPDELARIQEAGGRVIYWDGPRVLGVLAMSRAIGDNYLKPYVISEPEVTITDRTDDDECLILASDGLWDVVSNETACGVARMCLQSRKPSSPPRSLGNEESVAEEGEGESSDKACSDASILLTKLALARHTTDNVSVVVVDLRRKS